MYSRYLVVIVALMTFLCSSICTAETADEQRARLSREFGDIPRLTAQEVHGLFKEGKILIVDAHRPDRFKERHCLGAINIPSGVGGKFRLNVSKDTYIAIY